MKSKLLFKIIKNIKETIITALIISLFVFLAVNIIYSQNINDIYFDIVGGNEKSVISFLKQSKTLSDFNTLLNINTKIYGNSIKDSVFYDDLKRKQKIYDLEQLLQKYPISRDILTNLAILYSQEGNEKKVNEYIQKAQEIDPEARLNN